MNLHSAAYCWHHVNNCSTHTWFDCIVQPSLFNAMHELSCIICCLLQSTESLCAAWYHKRINVQQSWQRSLCSQPQITQANYPTAICQFSKHESPLSRADMDTSTVWLLAGSTTARQWKDSVASWPCGKYPTATKRKITAPQPKAHEARHAVLQLDAERLKLSRTDPRASLLNQAESWHGSRE